MEIAALQVLPWVIFTILGTFVTYCAYVTWVVLRAQQIGKVLVQKAHAFTDETSRPRSMLVLGDSTAVGVGSEPEKSVPGRLARYLSASVESYAESGGVTRDLLPQSQQARKDYYDLVHIHALFSHNFC